MSRIQALSNAKAHAAAPASVVDDGIPVLTDVYQGQDAFAAVELEQLFASSDLAAVLLPITRSQRNRAGLVQRPCMPRLKLNSSQISRQSLRVNTALHHC
ncbi:hypothetical protein [Methylobacillus glycogenes]|uniref:hypothetical protein n=1 Tax=Methylobacillus glycogenes TaxID=406 RepID=UPI0011DD3473|nr:hypothetical protein [Methylobacillus glycogenes]